MLTTHIRTTEAYLYYKLTNEPKGSGELKIGHVIANLIFGDFRKGWRRRTTVRLRPNYAENYAVGTTIPYILLVANW